MSAKASKNRVLPPFQLRPNKFVDRMVFVDLIARTVGNIGAQNFIYVSMGAKFLHDHHSVHRRIGIENLVSFGNDEDEVKRQKFNRPTNKMKCLFMDSSDLPDCLDEIRGRKNAIVWLDFTSPDERRSQFQQSEEVLRRLKAGDLLRVTFNANYGSFGVLTDDEKKEYGDIETMAAAKLTKQIEEFLPANLKKLKTSKFPAVLAKSMEKVAERAVEYNDDVQIVPVLSTTYADGSRMVTVACAVRPADEKKLPKSLGGWKLKSDDWDDLVKIDVPDLSMREKHHIDRRITSTPQKILRSIPYRSTEKAKEAVLLKDIDSYRTFHRYYPAFFHIDI